MKKLSSFILGIMLLSSCAYAIPEVLTEPMKEVLKQAPAMPSIANVVLSTLFMVLIIYVVAFTYQKLNSYNSKRFSDQSEKALNLNKMKITNCLSLGPNKCLYIVEVNEKFLVVGSTQTQINLLKEFDKKDLQKIIDAHTGATHVEKIKPEVIEEGLKTLFPKEEEIIETKKEDDVDFEEIYKKYI